MKKLTVLSLVFAMVSSVNATPYITVDGEDPGSEITIQPDDYIWIGPHLSFPSESVLEISGGIANGEWTGEGNLYYPPDVACIPELGPFCGFWDYDPEFDFWYYNPSPYTGPFNGVVANAEFHCTSEGDVTISLSDSSWEVVDTLTIHQIDLSPKTIIVNWDGSGDYTTIQEGIDAAASGRDTVVVAEGTYNENITFGGKNITVMSSDPNDPVVVAATIIDGGNSNTTVTFGGSEDSSCLLTGFTITSGNSASTGGGIAGGGAGAAISKCVIKGNSGQNGGGLADCDGTISNCLIYDNTSTLVGGAMHDCDGDIVNCTIVENTAGQDAGGMYGCDGTVTNGIIWGNNLAEVAGGSTPTYCCIQGWSGGGEGNISINPEFVNAGAEDYHLPPWSYCTDAGTNSPPGGLPATDLEGVARPIDGDNDGQATADMGCYESLASAEPVLWLEAASQALIIRNSGGGTLNWNISAGCSWVLPDPNSGSSTGEPNEVNFYLDTSGLNNGHHECMLTISDPCALNSPRYVILGLDIARPGDFDEDGEVNCDDLRALALAWMSKSGDDNWNPVCDISDPNDGVIDGRDFGVFAMDWDGCGDPSPEPAMSYNIEDCDLAKAAVQDKNGLRFSATVDGNYILFEDMMYANCCPEELLLEMTFEDNLITINEIEHIGEYYCYCMCDWPVTATLGPFDTGIYTLEVYEHFGGFIGSTIVTIE